jgi:hypothetical protein
VKYAHLAIALLLTATALGQSSVKPTFFGLHAHSNKFPTVAFGTYRCWDAGCRWNAQNPSYGSYSFAWMGSLFDQAKGATTIYTFGIVPAFASSQPRLTGCAYANGACAMPYVSDWTAFVQALAKYSASRKASGRKGIDLYELWNEPNAGNFWRGTYAQMVQLASAAYPLIHQYDPSAKVSTPVPQGTAGWQWMSGYFAAGGSRYADEVGFHGYTGTAYPESQIANVNALRSLMSQYGVSSKPLNDSEHYWWSISSAVSQASYLSRHMILAAAQGISKDVWYAWCGYGGSLCGTANANVYATVERWLLSQTVSKPVVVGPLYAVTAGRNKIVWTTSGSASVPAVGFTHWGDVWGGTHAITGSSLSVDSVPIELIP